MVQHFSTTTIERHGLPYPVAIDKSTTTKIGPFFVMMQPGIMTIKLNNKDIELIDYAVQQLHELAGENGINAKILSSIDANTFQLGELGIKLREASMMLHTEQPVLIIQGVDFTAKSNAERLAIQAGVGSYIGNLRASQSGNAVPHHNVNMHVTEVAKKDGFIASAITNAAMPFHSDSGDIISLTYWNNASKGRVHIASGAQVYNTLQASHPEVVETLFENWEWDIPGNVPDVVYRPLLNFTTAKDGRIQVTLQSERRPFFGDATLPRKAGLDNITAEQKKALSLIQQTCEAHAITFTPNTSDMVFLNNRAILHARDGYEGGSGRHAVRMVHRDQKNGWDIPKSLAQQYKTMYEGYFQVPRLEDWQIKPTAWENDAQHG